MKPSDDEVASAWLDGELDPAELAAAEHDDDVRRARHELAIAQRELSEPVPVPSGLREQHIARALDELIPSGAGSDRTVVALSSRRPGRAVRGGSWWLSRAAAAVLVIGGLGVGVFTLADREAPEDDMAASSVADEGSDTAGATDPARATGPGEGEELEALRAPAAGGAEDGGGAMQEEAGGRDEVAATAAALVEASPQLTAPELTARLVEQFGPAPDWPLPGGPAPCALAYDDRMPQGAPHVALAIRRAGTPAELVVPAEGPPLYVDPASCDPLP